MTQHAPAATEPAPSSSRRRTVCGWCNRLVSIAAGPGATRHVTCDDCRSVAAHLTDLRLTTVVGDRGTRS